MPKKLLSLTEDEIIDACNAYLKARGYELYEDGYSHLWVEDEEGSPRVVRFTVDGA